MSTSIAIRNGIQGSAHAYAAAVAGPVLIFAGWQYPGTWKAKAFIMGAGVLLIAAHYPFFDAALRSSKD